MEEIFKEISGTDGVIEAIISAVSAVVGWLLRKFIKESNVKK